MSKKEEKITIVGPPRLSDLGFTKEDIDRLLEGVSHVAIGDFSGCYSVPYDNESLDDNT